MTQVEGGSSVPNVREQLTGKYNDQNAAAGASFAISAETTSRTVSIQLLDAAGEDVAASNVVTAFLSDNATGLDISGTAPATSVAAGTDGSIIAVLVTKLAWILQSEADGDIDLVITEPGGDTWYLVVVLPNGKQVVSAAIVFNP
jgi:hypothetical protein